MKRFKYQLAIQASVQNFVPGWIKQKIHFIVIDAVVYDKWAPESYPFLRVAADYKDTKSSGRL